MTKQTIQNWIMYHEIHKLSRLGFSNSKIGRYLIVDARTVGKYLKMTEGEYEAYLISLSQRSKLLSVYEAFVAERLDEYQDTSTAQMHDWLKEAHTEFPEVSPRTVYNFVMYVRQKHNIPLQAISRQYSQVEELPYGQQAQMDFGEYNMRLSSGKRKKVWFFVMVLSRSRMKYVWFLDKPFTAISTCMAHEKAYAFFQGIPCVMVYDQDRVLLVDENLGDIILTTTFKEYTKSRNFELHFCRKSDPESKGKVESAVQYVKKNFLYNRTYSDLKTLNEQALAWLARTANHLPHNVTKKPPEQEFIIEQQHLKKYIPMNIENKELETYLVRKDNTINYKGTFYSVPIGTYVGDDTNVIIKENQGSVEIYSMEQTLICTHKLSTEKGKKVSNTNHKRDTSRSIDEMIQSAAEHFSSSQQATEYFEQIRKKYPRYIRDHMQVIIKTLEQANQPVADKTLDFCIKNNNINGNEWEQIMAVITDLQSPDDNTPQIKLLNPNSLCKAEQKPQKSNIDDYEHIVNH